MSKLLVQLLGVQERSFRQFVDRLEGVCLHPGIDIRLSAELITKTREKARRLGLDPADTTPKELYFALINQLKTDDAALRKALKLDGKKSDQVAKNLARQAAKLSKQERVLCMSQSGAKRLLTAVPPRKTLRALGLRSLESVLKREDARLLYALAVQLEDASWHSQAHAKMKRLPVKDIGWQPVNILAMPDAWYAKVADRVRLHGLQLVCPDVGLIVVLPVVENLRAGAATLTLGLILQAAQRLSTISMPYRRQGLLQGFHVIMPEIAHGRLPALQAMHGLMPTWHAVHELIARGLLTEDTLEVELLVSDLSWQTTEMKLASIVPSMDFWVDTSYLAAKAEPKPVSLHILDIARAALLQLPFGEQPTAHMEGSLWNELQLRYLQQDALSRSLQKQLLAHEEGML